MQKMTKDQLNNLLFGAAMYKILFNKKKNNNTLQTNIGSSFILLPVFIIAIIISLLTGHDMIAAFSLLLLIITAIKTIPLVGIIAVLFFLFQNGLSGIAGFLVAIFVISLIIGYLFLPETSDTQPVIRKTSLKSYDMKNDAPVASSNIIVEGNNWICKKCDTSNPLTNSVCKGCGEYK